MKELYISINEAEQLIFNRFIFIPKKRLTIVRASSNYSIKIFCIKEAVLTRDEYYLLFFNSIRKIEVPKADEKLFLNTYNLPAGYIMTADRKVRDEGNVKAILPLGEKVEKLNSSYTTLNRAMLALLQSSISTGSSAREFKIVSTLYKHHELLKDLLIPIVNNNPKVIKVKNNNNENLEYLIGALAQVNSSLQKYVKKYSDSDQIKKWFKELINLFLSKDNYSSFLSFFKSMPQSIYDLGNFFVLHIYWAYYCKSGRNILLDWEREEFYKEFESFSTDKQMVRLWIIFFEHLYGTEKNKYLYFVESLRKEAWNRELCVYNWLVEEEPVLDSNLSKINILKDREQLAYEYKALTQLHNGVSYNKSQLQVLSKSEKELILQEAITTYRGEKEGYCFGEFSYTDVDKIPNVIFTTKNGYRFDLTDYLSDVRFYCAKEQVSLKKYLDKSGIKSRWLGEKNLANKRVLIGAFNGVDTPKLFGLYKEVLLEQKDIKGVIILSRSKNIDFSEFNQLYEASFQENIKKQECVLQELFKVDTKLVLTDECFSNKVELVRTFSNLFNEYKVTSMNHVEFIYGTPLKYFESFIFDCFDQYFIWDECENYNYCKM